MNTSITTRARSSIRLPSAWLSLCALGLLVSACMGTGDQSGLPQTCLDNEGRPFTPCRVFRGRLQLPLSNRLLQQQKPFQIAAVAFEAGGSSSGDAGVGATVTPRLFFGQIFSYTAGAGQRADYPFALVVPCRLSVNLLVQVPTAGTSNLPGALVAPMAFEGIDGARTTLIPPQLGDLCGGTANSIDLEQVVLQVPPSSDITASSITLGTGKSRNPLDILDTDGDGQVDAADADDDDDGLADVSDDDANGDGIADALQLLSSLPDADNNGRPDLFE
jgi:hypothetical protein